jgi:hypothetical protein
MRPGVFEGRLGILDVRNDRQTAAIVGLAIQRRADNARRPLQQSDTEPHLQLLHHRRYRRPRQVQILRRQRKAAALHDSDEQSHDIDAVHGSPDCSLSLNSVGEVREIIQNIRWSMVPPCRRNPSGDLPEGHP